MNERDRDLRHLLSRTGFGAPTPGEIDALAQANHAQAVRALLDGVKTKAASPDPDWLDTVQAGAQRGMTVEQAKEFRRQRNMDGTDAKAWWYGEMLATTSPLTEHMTLFWHNHFTSSMKKVKVPDLLYRQNALHRANALGNFATLLRAASKDPAMLVYLDNNENQPDHPNENFARELLELFTLGEGHGYTEVDIREAARAFTGWRFRPDTGFLFQPRLHDTGQKTFLGRTGNFTGDDILDIILAQPRVAEYITEKLWREFISDAPDPAEVTRLAVIFRNAQYELRPLLEGLLTTEAFRAPDNRGALVKSPTDLIVGTYRLIGYTPRDGRTMVLVGRNLGQDLFDPPNVKGWPGGMAWIDTATVPQRYEFLNQVVNGLANLTQMPQRRPQNQAQAQQPRQAAGAPPPTQAQTIRPAPPGAAGQPPAPAGGNRQLNIAALDADALRAVATLPPDQMAQLVLPLPPSTMGSGPGGPLGDLIRDPAFQLK